MGYLGWKPKDFWESTPWEFSVSIEAYFDAEAIKSGRKKLTPMTRNDAYDLIDRVKELKADSNGNN